jgi:hypothetical protein
MGAPKSFPDWLKARVREEVREATKPPPVKPKPATAKPAPTPPEPRSPSRRGVTIMAAPDSASPTELANRGLARRVLAPKTDTDAHDVAGYAPCWCCGGATGTHATYRGQWRQHQECTTVAGSGATRLQAAARALGLGEVSLADAALLAVAAPVFSSVHPEPTWTGGERMTTSWAHVDRRALKVAIATLPSLRAEAGLVASECTDGACAWCGVVSSAGWFTHGHTWPDGSPAPLCAECSAVYVKHGEPSFPDEVRAALAELVTGVPPMMGESAPVGLMPFVEVSADTEGGEPWAHLDPEALRSYRFATWARFGLAYCPPEHRAEVEVWAAEREAARAARRAEEEAEEASRANVYGF